MTPRLLERVAEPRFLTHPPQVDSAGPEVVQLAASGGLHLDGWQQHVLDVALGERADGNWAAREVALICPRQNGKGSILEALILASLLLFEERLILYSAHEFKTAQETFLRVKTLIESNEHLSSQIARVYNAHGSEGIELTTGQRLRFVARSKGSGRGFSPQRIILDEALNLGAKAVSALLFSISAQPNAQLWYTSSAPDDSADGAVLRKIMRRGRAGDPGLAYIEYSADPDADPDEQVAQANPGYPHRISDDTIVTERGATEVEDYNRERLGIVNLDENAGKAKFWQVIAADQWHGRLRGDASPTGTLGWAVDASPDGRSAAISCSDGRTIEVVDHRNDVTWAPHRLLELRGRHHFDEVAIDATGPAGALIPALEELGVPYRRVTLQEHAQACGGFLAAVTGDAPDLVHRGQPPLDEAVKHAERRHVTDVWLWTRSKSSGDICPLVSAGLARWWALQQTDGGDFLVV